ncbi:MAG: hypothetical protein ACJAZO_004414 [Myxococcota bacterium]|jgi:hypothetical protein
MLDGGYRPSGICSVGLADVYGAIDEVAKRYPERMAAIKLRIEAANADD